MLRIRLLWRKGDACVAPTASGFVLPPARRLQHVDSYIGDSGADEPNFLCGRVGEVDDAAPSAEGSTIRDSDNDGLVGAFSIDAHDAAERQCPVCRLRALGIVSFAACHPMACERIRIKRSLAGECLDRFRTGESLFEPIHFIELGGYRMGRAVADFGLMTGNGNWARSWIFGAAS